MRVNMTTLIIFQDKETKKWFYQTSDITSNSFDTVKELFDELKEWGLVENECPTCEE
jgi:hypothetical protein